MKGTETKRGVMENKNLSESRKVTFNGEKGKPESSIDLKASFNGNLTAGGFHQSRYQSPPRHLVIQACIDFQKDGAFFTSLSSLTVHAQYQ